MVQNLGSGQHCVREPGFVGFQGKHVVLVMHAGDLGGEWLPDNVVMTVMPEFRVENFVGFGLEKDLVQRIEIGYNVITRLDCLGSKLGKNYGGTTRLGGVLRICRFGSF